MKRKRNQEARLIHRIFGISLHYISTQKFKLEKLNNQFLRSIHWNQLKDTIKSKDLQTFLSHINQNINVGEHIV